MNTETGQVYRDLDAIEATRDLVNHWRAVTIGIRKIDQVNAKQKRNRKQSRRDRKRNK